MKKPLRLPWMMQEKACKLGREDVKKLGVAELEKMLAVLGRIGDRIKPETPSADPDAADAKLRGKKKEIAMALLEAGRRERAIEVLEEAADGEPCNSNLLKCAAGLFRAGKPEAAARICEEILMREDGHIGAQLEMEVAAVMMKGGEKERAMEIRRNRSTRYNDGINEKYDEIEFIEALLEVGETERAMEIVREISELKCESPEFEFNVPDIKEKTGTVLAKHGMYEEALAIETGNDVADALLLRNIGMELIKAGRKKDGIKVLREAMERSFSGDNDYFEEDPEFERDRQRDVASTLAEAKLYDHIGEFVFFDTVLYGYIANQEAAEILAAKATECFDRAETLAETARSLLPTSDRRLLRAIAVILPFEEIKENDEMVAERTRFGNLFELSAEEKQYLLRKYKNQLEVAAEQGHGMRLPLEVLSNLSRMGENGATSILIEIGYRHRSYPILETLSELDSFKAKAFVLRCISSEETTDHQAWILIQRLIEGEYLDEDMQEFFVKRIEASGDREAERGFLLDTFKYCHRELNICPDMLLLEFVSREAANIDEVKERVNGIKAMGQEFRSAGTKEELVEMLQDEEKATAYFILNAGRTRYALVNNYDLGKFLTIVKKMKEYNDVHEGVLAECAALLPEGARERLMQGRFPVESEQSPAIRIDVSNSARMQVINRRAASVFGSRELGVVIKHAVYMEMDIPEKERLRECHGIADAARVLEEIDSEELEKSALMLLDKKWKKVLGKKVIEVGIEQVFSNEANQVSLPRMLGGLAQQRKALASSVRQQYKSRKITKDLKDERVRALDQKEKAKLMRYLIQDMIVGDREGLLFDEWEAHLDGVLQDFDKLKEPEKNRTKEKSVTVRWLDKKDDLIECARVADSAQCCFNSKNYIVQQNLGAADWIAMIWADPLSFAFQIEEDPKRDPTNAIGFIFGSFGKKESLAVLLNGVYMEGKTDTAVQVILDEVEQRFSKPLGAAYQMVAARHGGLAKLKGYSNEKTPVKRLRALKDARGEPINQIYDDLNVGVNKDDETNKDVWWKKVE